MRAFGDPSFFRLFNSLMSEASLGVTAFSWTYRGVQWIRNRHTFGNQLYGFGTDTFLLSKPAPRPWLRLVVKEFWHETDGTMRSGQWAKPLSGEKTDIRLWIQLEEKRLREVEDNLATSIKT